MDAKDWILTRSGEAVAGEPYCWGLSGQRIQPWDGVPECPELTEAMMDAAWERFVHEAGFKREASYSEEMAALARIVIAALRARAGSAS